MSDINPSVEVSPDEPIIEVEDVVPSADNDPIFDAPQIEGGVSL